MKGNSLKQHRLEVTDCSGSRRRSKVRSWEVL